MLSRTSRAHGEEKGGLTSVCSTLAAQGVKGVLRYVHAQLPLR